MEEQRMSNASNHLVDLLPTPSDSPTAIAGLALFAGVFLLFMGFKEYSGGSSQAMDSGIKKIGLGIVATLLGAGIAATRQLSAATQDEHAPLS
jgi:amino acid transporter